MQWTKPLIGPGYKRPRIGMRQSQDGARPRAVNMREMARDAIGADLLH